MYLSPRDVFDRQALRRICTMHETEFERTFDFGRYSVEQPVPDDFYLFRDNGSSILAVAHLDTVGKHEQRAAHFLHTSGGEVVYSRALDDRLGAYIILDMLPKLGIDVDVLLTVGEESGRSTAAFFDAHKQYEWMIEFDRGGTDVVMYQYEDADTRAAVRDSGARVGEGIFSDICYLEHLGVKGFNWGVGYRDYHGPRAHAYLDDTFMMVETFVNFYVDNVGVKMPHVDERGDYYLDAPSTRGMSWFEQIYETDKRTAAVLDDDWLDEDYDRKFRVRPVVDDLDGAFCDPFFVSEVV